MLKMNKSCHLHLQFYNKKKICIQKFSSKIILILNHKIVTIYFFFIKKTIICEKSINKYFSNF